MQAIAQLQKEGKEFDAMEYLSGLDDQDIMETEPPKLLMLPQSMDSVQQIENDASSLIMYHWYSSDVLVKFGALVPQVVPVRNTPDNGYYAWDVWCDPRQDNAYSFYWEMVQQYRPTHVFVRGMASPEDGDELRCIFASAIVTLYRPNIFWSILGTNASRESVDSPWSLSETYNVSQLPSPLCEQIRNIIKMVEFVRTDDGSMTVN